jgi:hypothetical protein
MAISVPMNASSRKRRTRVERFVAGVVLIAALGAPAFQQRPVLAQEIHCAQIATAAERLACYDRALPPVEAAPPAVPQPQPQSRAEPSRPVAVSPAAAPSAGAEPREEPEATPVVIVGMRKYSGRSASFTTDKGDVWIQIGAESVYLPKVPFDAELRPASMGTYFLRPRDYGWRVHVRRND